MPKLTKNTLFKSSNRAEDKWETTNSISRSMTEAEQTARDKKTERLRKLRIAADQQPEPAKEKPAVKRRASAKR